MLQKHLYHVTDKEHLPLILKNGLIPQIGENAIICDEDAEAIYLCDCGSVLYWQILLDKPVVVRFPINAIPTHDLEKFEYAGYEEYVTHHAIPAESIQKVSMRMPKNITYAMRKLCINYLYTISDMCIQFARYYLHVEQNDVSDTEADFLMHTCKVLLVCLSRLNYKYLPTLDEEIRKIGDSGEPTFLDMYINKGKRFYQMLLEYPDDEFTDYRKQLHAYIVQTFQNELHINTGGIELYCASYNNKNA